MTLKALQQWICDKCGDVIEKPTDGWLEWLSDRDNFTLSGFKIVHHAPASPHKAKNRDCYHYNENLERQDMHLDIFLGVDGIARMITWTYSPGVKSLEEWAEVFRRLHVPHYEEARRHWDAATSDGEIFEGVDEESRYSQDILKSIIQQHQNQE